jgi:hypothetical protein
MEAELIERTSRRSIAGGTFEASVRAAQANSQFAAIALTHATVSVLDHMVGAIEEMSEAFARLGHSAAH